MGHGSYLTKEEYKQFRLHPEIFRYLETYRKSQGLEKNEINILDWGCGRGLSVAWLRDRDYNAYGVEIDSAAIHHGRAVLESYGHNIRHIIGHINNNCVVNFPDNFFHYVFSTQVLEHVENLDLVASEMYRITTPGGQGLHIFPGHRHIIEAHLSMPFVHWLPKNGMRKKAILFFVLCGIKPNWGDGIKDKDLAEQARIYYEYSKNFTHYRNLSTICHSFKKIGFSAKSISINHPVFARNTLFAKLLTTGPIKIITDWAVNNFKTVELLTIKTVHSN